MWLVLLPRLAHAGVHPVAAAPAAAARVAPRVLAPAAPASTVVAPAASAAPSRAPPALVVHREPARDERVRRARREVPDAHPPCDPRDRAHAIHDEAAPIPREHGVAPRE